MICDVFTPTDWSLARLDLDVFMFLQRRWTKCSVFFVLKCSPEADLKETFSLYLHC